MPVSSKLDTETARHHFLKHRKSKEIMGQADERIVRPHHNNQMEAAFSDKELKDTRARNILRLFQQILCSKYLEDRLTRARLPPEKLDYSGHLAVAAASKQPGTVGTVEGRTIVGELTVAGEVVLDMVECVTA